LGFGVRISAENGLMRKQQRAEKTHHASVALAVVLGSRSRGCCIRLALHLAQGAAAWGKNASGSQKDYLLLGSG
jgi:hypothetical protein